jgi:hypothetical protein
MHHRKLCNVDWSIIEERFKHKLSTCKVKHLSYGGRLVLLNFVLSSLPMFMMSISKSQKGVLGRLDFYRSRFFWQGTNDKKILSSKVRYFVLPQRPRRSRNNRSLDSKQMTY